MAALPVNIDYKWANRTCPYCTEGEPRRFLTLELARKHIQQDHPDKPIPETEPRKSARDHGLGSNRCNECGRTFPHYTALTVHLAKTHGMPGRYSKHGRETRQAMAKTPKRKYTKRVEQAAQQLQTVTVTPEYGSVFHSAALGKSNGPMADLRDPQFLQVLIMPEADGRVRLWINGLDGTKFRAQGIGNCIINNMAGGRVAVMNSDESAPTV